MKTIGPFVVPDDFDAHRVVPGAPPPTDEPPAVTFGPEFGAALVPKIALPLLVIVALYAVAVE